MKGAEPTPRGLLGVAIKKDGAGTLTMINLPAGTVARVSVPVTSANAQVLLNGKPESGTPEQGGKRVAVILSQKGHYEIQSH